MSWLGRALRGIVDAAHPSDPGLMRLFRIGRMADAGVEVTEDTVLGIPGVFAAINVIAESLAAAPLQVYRRNPDGSRTAVEDHWLAGVIGTRGMPNEWMTGFDFREMAVRDACLHGEAVFRKEVNGAGRVTALHPFDPPWIAVERRASGGYRYRAADGRVYFEDEILRLPYKLGRDNRAIAPLTLHGTAFGTAIAARTYQARLLANDARPPGALQTDSVLTPEAVKRTREDWEGLHRGPMNAGRIAILDAGLKYVNFSMSNRDAQLAELMQLTLGDIVRIFRVPPHKVGDLSRSTNNNIEHQSIEFVQDTLLPWATRHEARLNASLLSRSGRREFFIGYDLKGLMRGDAEARASFYRNMFYMSSMSPNEIRRMEDMAPVEGGDQLYVQGATVPIDLQRLMAGDMADRPAGAGTD